MRRANATVLLSIAVVAGCGLDGSGVATPQPSAGIVDEPRYREENVALLDSLPLPPHWSAEPGQDYFYVLEPNGRVPGPTEADQMGLSATARLPGPGTVDDVVADLIRRFESEGWSVQAFRTTSRTGDPNGIAEIQVHRGDDDLACLNLSDEQPRTVAVRVDARRIEPGVCG